MEDKQLYFVDIKSGEITKEPTPENTFTIIADEDEIQDLRDLFEENYKADLKGYARTHLPAQEYHTFSENENAEYDTTMETIYAILYRLGDADTRRHIKEMGILREQDYDNGNFR
ncbi:hypothetical protein A8F94_21860 [Bacillus sp. FJAT-27225]|uniref:hypothetical protein n=1 Tax=Bacillus sp. FJAT-27225 TaxID=1743144 RepID=UPI00080C27D9|nr:hypothetical protein [Bacillus sp. FJAT-27225]OCA81523.1 hypothetical protein A8F94_21860 [Bacillus sp. FJAT-27225]